MALTFLTSIIQHAFFSECKYLYYEVLITDYAPMKEINQSRYRMHLAMDY